MNRKTAREVEVEWYRKNGRYKYRIARDINGKEYVIGDFSWNQNNPTENIEHLMRIDIVYETCIDFIPSGRGLLSV